MDTTPKRPRSQLEAPQDLTEGEAREYIERLRWPNGPTCPHCGSASVYRMAGRTIRAGLLACRGCNGQFTVTVGTVMADSHLPLSTWVRAFHLIASSKMGTSALQLQRDLNLGSYKTAWQLAHRIRAALKCEPLAGLLQGSVLSHETSVRRGGRRGTRSARDSSSGTSANSASAETRRRYKIASDARM